MPSISQQRIDAIKAFVDRSPRKVDFPKDDKNKPVRPSQCFAMNVFTTDQLQKCLPRPVFLRILAMQSGHEPIDRLTADAVAHAVKVWALEHGATHFTHWFQPQTNATAEKHDSFLNLVWECNGTLTTSAIESFSGKELMQAEPDASSFPNGGRRSTFEARGYTVWDTTSPMFLQEGPHGTKVLYIPSVFISYNGEALDEKTVLLRSCEALNRKGLDLLALLGQNHIKRLFPTLGCEQEFFLLDRHTYSLRPDLKLTGRTLLGCVPPKHQQLEDHYFGNIPTRVLSCLSEVELELWKLGVPIKTRHNEVAPQQFEMAPIFEEASVAVDHNLLTMEMLHKVAHRHKLKAIFHEKPFKGVNGSGKHCNWSIQTDANDNLLDPTDKPEDNARFLLFLAAILWGVNQHQGLLRAAIASSSNQWRLGANEAPPSIISVFLGAQLSEVCNAIEEGRPVKATDFPKIKSISVGGTCIDLKIRTIPEVKRDATDRNRTSPFAFTGNKFEFRAVGSKQSPSFPVAIINALATAGLDRVIAELKTRMAGGERTITLEGAKAVVQKILKECRQVRFDGDGYSAEWRAEAERRGLLHIRSEPEAFAQLLSETNRKMLVEQTGIITEEELESRFHVLNEKYIKDMIIEAKTLDNLISQCLVPAAYKYRQALIGVVAAPSECLKGSEVPEAAAFKALTEPLVTCQAALDGLRQLIAKVEAEQVPEKASKLAISLVSGMELVREQADRIESRLADEYYPMPKYTELLFN